MKRRKQEDKVKRVQQQEECFKHVKVANLLVLAATKTEACDPIASTGAVLFLADMIDRLDHYMIELQIRRKNVVAMKKLEATKALEEEREKLKVELIQLEFDLKSK
ncbi:hypothetical protein Ahy_A01g001205 isoform B [Arachis hypogaea]|uniref:Uncharacterized protein n=1 Tax=Arachis hypogaea TaxID=3818 RepID=A0A445EML9_ARAHY|nr:hypothetical protein Ahy_A01g001205 isoform B [Arachis hypogaea]